MELSGYCAYKLPHISTRLLELKLTSPSTLIFPFKLKSSVKFTLYIFSTVVVVVSVKLPIRFKLPSIVTSPVKVGLFIFAFKLLEVSIITNLESRLFTADVGIELLGYCA